MRESKPVCSERGGSAPHIRLVMIVKNEAHCIQRCLDSVMPHVDSWCICDTGSSDETVDRIMESANKPGVLFNSPWVDFSHNRNLVFDMARNMGPCDYFFVIDADEYLTGDLSEIKDAPIYFMPMEHCDRTFSKPCVMRSDIPWRYEGRIHEELHPVEPMKEAVSIHCGTIISTNEGGRHHAEGWALRDIAAAEHDLAERYNARKMFHLAQMYEASGLTDKALDAYRKRAEDMECVIERWWSKVRIAEIMKSRTSGYLASVADTYIDAFQTDPSRIEPMIMLADYMLSNGMKQEANTIYASMQNVAKPCAGLFIVSNCYGRSPVE